MKANTILTQKSISNPNDRQFLILRNILIAAIILALVSLSSIFVVTLYFGIMGLLIDVIIFFVLVGIAVLAFLLSGIKSR